MKGRIALSALLCTVALIAVAAVPASARVPGGQGLTSFGFTDCGEPLGVVEIFGPRGELASTAYLIDTAGTGPHVVATRLPKSPLTVSLSSRRTSARKPA